MGGYVTSCSFIIEFNVIYFSCHDLSSWELWEDMLHIVKQAADNVELPDEVW